MDQNEEFKLCISISCDKRSQPPNLDISTSQSGGKMRGGNENDSNASYARNLENLINAMVSWNCMNNTLNCEFN